MNVVKKTTMNKSKLAYYIAAGGVVVMIAGWLCTRTNKIAPQPTSSATSNVQVTVSFYPLYFFTQSIGGQYVQVETITPPGSEPHDYEPSAHDIARIEKSRVLVLNGGVESWGDRIQTNLKGTDVNVVIAGQGLFLQRMNENGGNIPDPHVWLDPMLAKQEAHRVGEAIISADPGHALYYQQNEQELDAELDALDEAYRNGLSNCARKDIITSHAAFGYMAGSYGLRQVAIAGLSPDEEPSAQQLAKVADFAKENNVKFIFFESMASPKLAQTIADEVNAQALALDPLEGLSNDNIQAGKNYFTVMRDNLKNLRTALECK